MQPSARRASTAIQEACLPLIVNASLYWRRNAIYLQRFTFPSAMGNTKEKEANPLNIYRSVYQRSKNADNYNDGYNLDRGADIVYRLSVMYPNASPEALAGVAASALMESYGNPRVRQGQKPDATGKATGGAVGLFGWDGARRDALMKAYAKEWENIDKQLEYFNQENMGGERKNWAKVLQSTTPEQAAERFTKLWERAGTPHMDKRKTLAKDLYNHVINYTYSNMGRYFNPTEFIPLMP